MGKKLNIKIGDKFVDYTVISSPFIKEIGILKSKRRYVTCQCKCGFIIDIPCTKLYSKKKCKKCSRKERIGSKNHSWKGYKELSRYYYNKLISSATERKLEFNISIEYLYNLFEKQQGICALSGIKLILHPNQTASLDRIDSSKGYIEGNVQWVHKDVNYIKMDLGELEFIEWCMRITSHRGFWPYPYNNFLEDEESNESFNI